MNAQRLLLLVVLLTLSATAHAQRFNQKQINDGIRYGNFEVSLLVQSQHGISEEFEKFISTRRQVPPPDGYVTKPVDSEQFVDMVKKLLA